MRNTIKAYIKTVEKARADDRAKAGPPEEMAAEAVLPQVNVNGHGQEDETTIQQQGVDATEDQEEPADEAQPSIEVSRGSHSVSSRTWLNVALGC